MVLKYSCSLINTGMVWCKISPSLCVFKYIRRHFILYIHSGWYYCVGIAHHPFFFSFFFFWVGGCGGYRYSTWIFTLNLISNETITMTISCCWLCALHARIYNIIIGLYRQQYPWLVHHILASLHLLRSSQSQVL